MPIFSFNTLHITDTEALDAFYDLQAGTYAYVILLLFHRVV